MAEAQVQAAFDREFRGHIERFRDPLVAALRTLLATPLPVSEIGVGFELLLFQMQADWRHFEVRAFAMDRRAVDDVGVGPPFRGRVLPTSAGPLVPDGAIDQRRYEAAGVRTYASGARALAEWFGECWHAAGGAAFPLPTYMNLHDSSRYFDLHARRWVQHTEIGR